MVSIAFTQLQQNSGHPDDGMAVELVLEIPAYPLRHLRRSSSVLGFFALGRPIDFK
jgi:hypothetical protein